MEEEQAEAAAEEAKVARTLVRQAGGRAVQ